MPDPRQSRRVVRPGLLRQNVWTILSMMLLLCWIAGCSVQDMRHGLYEGFREHPLQSAPDERPRKEAPTFEQYERMRKERGWSSGGISP